jgi:hypothetical protein
MRVSFGLFESGTKNRRTTVDLRRTVTIAKSMYVLKHFMPGTWPSSPGWYRSNGSLACCADGCPYDRKRCIKIDKPMWITGEPGTVFCSWHAKQVGASALSETVSDC